MNHVLKILGLMANLEKSGDIKVQISTFSGESEAMVTTSIISPGDNLREQSSSLGQGLHPLQYATPSPYPTAPDLAHFTFTNHLFIYLFT